MACRFAALCVDTQVMYLRVSLSCLHSVVCNFKRSAAPPPAPPAMETLRQRHPDQVPIHLSNGVAYLWESRGTSATYSLPY